MGCDGGTIPTRDELVRTKKKPEQKDKDSELATKWKQCSISQEVLRRPVMACELGRLYNKESIIEFLLDRSQFESASNFSHVRGLKDLKELSLTDNPDGKKVKADTGDGYRDTQHADYICPVTGLTMNGRYRFSFIWTCGCVMSERALKEVKSDVCHKCGKAFTDSDVVILNCAEDELDDVIDKMNARREMASLKKKNKSRREKAEAPSVNGSDTVTDLAGPSCSKQGKVDIQQTKGKSAKLQNGHCKTSTKVSNPTSGSSIQHDPAASSAYKSLFTTSSSARKQESPHWITYNPMYY